MTTWCELAMLIFFRSGTPLAVCCRRVTLVRSPRTLRGRRYPAGAISGAAVMFGLEPGALARINN